MSYVYTTVLASSLLIIFIYYFIVIIIRSRLDPSLAVVAVVAGVSLCNLAAPAEFHQPSWYGTENIK
ncbi:hypothetical protein F5Y12DRAFT_740687, partial [Xylaria sp. FL1777]